jgi:hypothetical protein
LAAARGYFIDLHISHLHAGVFIWQLMPPCKVERSPVAPVRVSGCKYNTTSPVLTTFYRLFW